MSLVGDPRPPLPEWIIDAYTVLSTQIADAEPGNRQHQVPVISREKAVDVLSMSDKLALESKDADYAITRLLDRGYLYEVDNELRVTLPFEER